MIELSKFKKYMNNTALTDCVKFIINPKVIDMSNEEVKKAKEVLDELSQDEHERRLAELREKYIMDQKATEAAGYDKGYEQGKKNKTLELEVQVDPSLIAGIKVQASDLVMDNTLVAKINAMKEAINR